jgi:hypothetical protein
MKVLQLVMIKSYWTCVRFSTTRFHVGFSAYMYLSSYIHLTYVHAYRAAGGQSVTWFFKEITTTTTTTTTTENDD